MPKFKVFISSVQSEFASERLRLYDYVRQDDLMSQYFEPFIFEKTAAQDTNPRQLYLDEAAASEVYLALIGQYYGNAADGELSPTEKEYNAAGEGNAYRVAFIKDLDEQPRDEREERFFRRVQEELTYRVFSNPSVLLSLVKQSLHAFLKYKGIIQEQSLDEQVRYDANMDEIDPNKVREFIRKARNKRGFPLPEDTTPLELLKHFRMLRDGKPTNAALLLFAKDPQFFFPTAVVKCAWFLTNEVMKPIEDYKTFEGDVLDQISQATSWVMSKLSLRHEARNVTPDAEAVFELPRPVIFETIVNAVVHRDYNSKGSVQVSVFRNRVVVRNPGRLPVDLTKADLMTEHGSFPHNPFLAEALYQVGYIEKYGTGITENIRKMLEAHLLAPTIDLGGEFVTTIWREDKEGNVASGESNMASKRANMATNIASESPNVASEEANIASGLPNIASGVPNIACETSNIASVKQTGAIDYLEANKRLIDSIVAPKVKQRMKPEQIHACIIEACIVEHSTEELAALLHKAPAYLRNFIIPDLITEGILLRTKPRTANGQTYITNPKYR